MRVKNIMKNNKMFFVCGECCLACKKKKWAEKCATWCKKYGSRNIEITKSAMNKKKTLLKK